MLIKLMGDMPIREFVPRAGQEVPGMSKSNVDRLMRLARQKESTGPAC